MIIAKIKNFLRSDTDDIKISRKLPFNISVRSTLKTTKNIPNGTPNIKNKPKKEKNRNKK
ncbi:hypothetical protein JCM13991_05950 [Thermodesulfovibrio hydrogeniphilus]